MKKAFSFKIAENFKQQRILQKCFKTATVLCVKIRTFKGNKSRVQTFTGSNGAEKCKIPCISLSQSGMRLLIGLTWGRKHVFPNQFNRPVEAHKTLPLSSPKQNETILKCVDHVWPQNGKKSEKCADPRIQLYFRFNCHHLCKYPHKTDCMLHSGKMWHFSEEMKLTKKNPFKWHCLLARMN